MTLKIFDFTDYRSFLRQLLQSYPKKGHGVRGAWAKAIHCQSAFVSHVLNGLYDFSLEQAEALAHYLQLNKEETEYFLLLVQKERAGTVSLKKFYTQLLKEKIDQREHVRERMKIKNTLKLEDQAIYYSKWLYAAVHILLTIPEYQTAPEKIAIYFHVPLFTIREILEFLETREIIILKNGRYVVQNHFLFISKESPLFSNQQSFWRQKAIESIYQNDPEEIHFSSIFTISETDIKKIKKILLTSIEDSTQIIKPSKEEKLYSICMDFFEVK